jgi:hypothetical protein
MSESGFNIHDRFTEDKSDPKAQFLRHCSKGLTLTQIAVRMGMFKEELLKLPSQDKSWDLVFRKGKELCQAFHEDLLSNMILNPDRIDSKDKDLQRWRLETLFKEDWSGKEQEASDKRTFQDMESEELANRIKVLLKDPEVKKHLGQ